MLFLISPNTNFVSSAISGGIFLSSCALIFAVSARSPIFFAAEYFSKSFFLSTTSLRQVCDSSRYFFKISSEIFREEYATLCAKSKQKNLAEDFSLWANLTFTISGSEVGSIEKFSAMISRADLFVYGAENFFDALSHFTASVVITASRRRGEVIRARAFSKNAGLSDSAMFCG